MIEKIGLYLNKFEFKDIIYLLLIINNNKKQRQRQRQNVSETVNKYLQKTFFHI